MDWSLWHVLEHSDNSEVVSQSQAIWFIGYCGLTALGASIVASIAKPMKTQSWVNLFWTTVCLAVVVSQYTMLASISVLLTPDLEGTVVLRSCRESTKGGKLHGSFRDCTVGEGEQCTKESPCQPCDVPVPPYEFDGVSWDSSCQVCSSSFSGKCHFTKQNGPYCIGANGSAEPCIRCCLATVLGSQFAAETLSENNCKNVYDTSNFKWDDSGAYGCADPDFPVTTRFGCCPSDSSLGDLADTTKSPVGTATALITSSVSSQQEESKSGESAILAKTIVKESCLLKGPYQSSWGFCGYTVSDALYLGIMGIQGTSDKVDGAVGDWRVQGSDEHILGCPILRNGKFVEFYCRPPSIVNATALLP